MNTGFPQALGPSAAAQGPRNFVTWFVLAYQLLLEQEGRGSAPPLPEFARSMTGTLMERFNLSPGLRVRPCEVRSLLRFIRDLHFGLIRHLLQATGGGCRLLALLSVGGKNAQSDQLHVIGTHPEDLGTKVLLVVRLRDARRDMLASELVSKCSVCLTSGVGGVLHARIVRISPRGFFDNGEIIVAFLLLDVHEYMYAYNCLRRFPQLWFRIRRVAEDLLDLCPERASECAAFCGGILCFPSLHGAYCGW